MHAYLRRVCVYNIYVCTFINSRSAHSWLTYSNNNGEKSPQTANIHFGRVRGRNIVARIIIIRTKIKSVRKKRGKTTCTVHIYIYIIAYNIMRACRVHTRSYYKYIIIILFVRNVGVGATKTSRVLLQY